jgi:hypothetical protein
MHGKGNVSMHVSMRKDRTSWVRDETVKSILARVHRDSVDGTTVEVNASLARPAGPGTAVGGFSPYSRHATTQQRAGAGDHRMQRLSFSASATHQADKHRSAREK